VGFKKPENGEKAGGKKILTNCVKTRKDKIVARSYGKGDYA
jgi:hypothetical protein